MSSKPDGGVVAPRPTARMGALYLRVEPGAMLFLNGWQMGWVHKEYFTLAAGRHSLKLVNTRLHQEVTQDFSISRGKTTRLEFNLEK